MQFQVPQFIDVEDKIFGPFTFKQFIYLAGGGGLAFVIYKLLPIYIAVLFIAPVIVLAFMLTFYKVNNRPFMLILEAAFKHLFRDKMFLWKKVSRPAKKEDAQIVAQQETNPQLTGSKLKELSWGLDIMDMKQKK